MTDSVTITNNRTGESVTAPVVNGAVDASAWQEAVPGIWFYDHGLKATAAYQSSITFLDGNAGVLRYHGYPIEQLATESTYLEVAYLLIHGELPTPNEYSHWVESVTLHTFLHENAKKMIDGFHYDAHPMGILTSMIAALSTLYPESKITDDVAVRDRQIMRLIAKMPTLAAFTYRYSIGMPFVYPDMSLSYTENFLSMMWRMAEPRYAADPVLARALDVLFILHADHEQNCSTTVMRSVASSLADPYVSTAAAAAALSGPRHGGANEAVMRMLRSIGSMENVPAFVESVKEGKGRLQGFGHRVYKNYDPRATVMKNVADQVFSITGKNPLLDIALKLEETALRDEYFASRKLYPNVDFYSGLIYEALGFPVDMYTVLFAIPRTSGWLAHWAELVSSDTKITRPRQVYTGVEKRDYVPLAQRSTNGLN